MYGNVDAALLYFTRFTEYAINKNGLNLTQSKSDPCLFFRKINGKTMGIIVIYVDDCVIAGEKTFIDEMKGKLKSEFGVVEDGQLKKILGVRYDWQNLSDPIKAQVVLRMDNKANEIIESLKKQPENTQTTENTGKTW